MDKRKFLVDCDTGTDDAIAIIAALYEPTVQVVAFTAVDGNVEVKYTSKNTLDLVDCLGFDTPVAVGAHEGLQLRFNYHGQDDSTHGSKGMGSVVLPEAKRSFSPLTAVETIYREALKYGGELEILAVGPLTNIALAIIEHPEIKTLIKHLWIMGGAVIGGNVSTTAEFNIWADPEAGHLVFGSGIPITMVGLDVTEKAILDEEDAAYMRSLGTKAGDITAEILEFMFRRRDNGDEDAMMHDALAFAAAVCPECLVTKRYFVDVECRGTYTFGHTACDTLHRLGRPENADVAVGLDLPRFKKFLRDTIANSR